MTTFLLRGAFANQFELQNYEPLAHDFNLHLIASRYPLTSVNIPTTHLWSPQDLPTFPYKHAILNRLLGDPHWLLGLHDLLTQKESNGSNYRTIVHTAETYYAYTHQAVQLRKKGRIKTLISTCWETIPHNNESLARKKAWKVEARRHIDHFITPTNRAEQALIKEGVDAHRISLIRVGVDLNRFKPVKPRKHIKNILFIGRVEEEKGISDLLEMAQRIPKGINLTIIGQGKYRMPSIPNVHRAQLPYSSIHKAYQDADLFILPSRATPTWEEQYGMVLIEAMASGLPIITTKTGAIPEVVGPAAFLVKERSPEELYQALQFLLKNDGKRQELAITARKRAEERFDRTKIAKQLADLYNRLL